MSWHLPKFELYEEGGQIGAHRRHSPQLLQKDMEEENINRNFIGYFTFSQSKCDETIEHPDYLYETKSFTDKDVYDKLKERHTPLSKQINKFIEWVGRN
ncbi:hypothetical protein [Niabella aquatica]